MLAALFCYKEITMADFKYHNENPKNARINDCVVRAISYASDLPYETIEEKLFYTGELLDCDSLCVCCYSFLLTDVLGYKPIECDGLTLNEFADLHPYGLYLVRSNGHISVLDNNTVEDTWDCRDMILTNAWRIM